MRGRIPDRFIDELLARVDIVDVVERRLPLKKAGREWTACCPFHDERSPSFYVSPAKQFFHCFGCGAHGSAIRFLMDYERLEFPDAVEDLARSVGLTVPYEGGRDAAMREDKTDLYALLEAAAAYYQQQLPGQPEAEAYCRRRGLDAQCIDAFRIGWAPAGFDGLTKTLGTTPERLRLLEQAGMLASNERGHRYDRFRERLMFPILDRRGRVIAFGGRVIGEAQGPKYLNSPETPLFHKGRELFALSQVRQAPGQRSRILVVEGYMDAIAIHQAGLPIAVATLGTATTPEHAETLFRTAPDVLFCFDGDRAGRAAAWKALEASLPRLRDGRQAYFLFLPDGEDPDSLIRQEGLAGFEARLAAAQPLSRYFFEELSRDVQTASLDGRARLAERARPLLARLPDGAFRDLMTDELEKRSGARLHRAVPLVTPGARPLEVKRSLVRSAIASLLSQPSLAILCRPPYEFAALTLPGIPLLIEMLERIHARSDIMPIVLLEQFAGRAEYPALQKLLAVASLDQPEVQQQVFQDTLRRLSHRARLQRRDALSARWQSLSEAEKNELRQLLLLREEPRADAIANGDA